MDGVSFLRNSIEDKSRILLNNTWYFCFFMLSVILGTLIFYRHTQDELTPAIVLSLLWLLFWKESTSKGRIFLVIASVFGYVHELLGVQYGYFTYLGGAIGGVPIWILPGYGTIFWSAHNLWKIFEKSYSKKDWFHLVNYFVVASFVVLFAADYVAFDLSQNPAGIMIKFFFVFLLFRTFDGLRLAYFVAFFTVLTEFSGEMLGTWAHPDFSLFSLMAGYVFLLWVCLTINNVAISKKILGSDQNVMNGVRLTMTNIIKGNNNYGRIEIVAALILTVFYTLSLLGMFAV